MTEPVTDATGPQCVIAADPPRYNQGPCGGPATWSLAYMTADRELIVRREPVCAQHARNEIIWHNRRARPVGRVEMSPMRTVDVS